MTTETCLSTSKHVRGMAEDFLAGGPLPSKLMKPSWLEDPLAKKIYVPTEVENYSPAIFRQHPGYTQLIRQGGFQDLDLTKIEAKDILEATDSLIDKYRNRVCKNLKEIIFKNGKELTIMTNYDKISVSREELNRPNYNSIIDTRNGVAVFFGASVDVTHTCRDDERDPFGYHGVLASGSSIITDEYKVSVHQPGIYNNVQRQILDIIRNANPVSDSRDGFKIKKVIFNRPATIVFWTDGTKTVVVCNEKLDTYDPEKGLAMCFAKKALGNKWDYYNVFLHELKHAPKTTKK